MDTQYLEYEDGEVHFTRPFQSKTHLDPQIYSVLRDNNEKLYLEKYAINTETLVSINDGPVPKMLQKIEFFLGLDARKRYKDHGMLYKRGVMLHGPPGTGKSSAVNQLISIATQKKDMIVLMDPFPGWVKEACEKIRQIEGDRPILVVWEEFEETVRRYESELLDLLDGVDQVENILYIATTNYLNKIPDRICRRPSRFADIIEVGYPDASVRYQFLSAKLGKGYDLEKWVESTEGLSIDHLKDMIINTVVFEKSFEEALENARALSPSAMTESEE